MYIAVWYTKVLYCIFDSVQIDKIVVIYSMRAKRSISVEGDLSTGLSRKWLPSSYNELRGTIFIDSHHIYFLHLQVLSVKFLYMSTSPEFIASQLYALPKETFAQ